jgi:uncharacterized protein YndB with AHSA1/START domain
MTVKEAGTSVRASVLVGAPIDRAFKVFTDEISTWWPPDHHIIEGEVAGVVFEPRAGGYVYDRTTDGRECRWARVLAYEPPQRVVFSWDISSQWQIESDHDKTSEIEVTFTSEGPTRTRVELEHRKLDRHGEGWEAHRDSVGSPDGWQKGLDAFAKVAAA